MEDLIPSLFQGELDTKNISSSPPSPSLSSFLSSSSKNPNQRHFFHEIPLKVGGGSGGGGVKTLYDSLDFFSKSWKGGKPFLSLPPILCLNLGKESKSTERFFCEYYREIDLGRYIVGGGGEEGGEGKEREGKYQLFAVVCHGGEMITGHFSAYIRQGREFGGKMGGRGEKGGEESHATGEWVHFNDELVVRVKEREAMENNFGLPDGGKYVGDRVTNLLKVGKKYSHAVMLFYVREGDMERLFGVEKEKEKEEKEEEGGGGRGRGGGGGYYGGVPYSGDGREGGGGRESKGRGEREGFCLYEYEVCYSRTFFST